MSTGGLLGGVAGGVVGFFIGGPVGAMYGASIGFGLGMAIDPLKPDVEGLGYPEISQLNITTAQEGLPIADALGTAKMTGNLIGYWNSRSEEVTQEVSGGKGGGSSEKVVTGHKYFLTWAVGLCMGPANMLYTIYNGDDCVWEGELARPASGGEETITIPGIGSVTFYFGTDDQVASSVLAALVEDATLLPAYRYLVYAVFDDCFIGESNRLPIFRFVIKKAPEYAFNDKQEVEVYDYNLAHSTWHIITEMVGLDETWLDEISFSDAANALYYENRGVTMLMDSQAEALSYLQSLLAHMDGILRYGIDGKFHLKLLRADQQVEDLPTVDGTMMLDDMQLSRKGWIDTLNDIKVQYALRYFGDECNGEEVQGDGQGNDSPPVLTYLGCADETYLFPAVLGEYEITGGRGPWLLMYKNEDMDDWEVRRVLPARSFSSLCREIKCAGQEADQQMKLKDLGFKDSDVYSNIVDISISLATDVYWGGDKEVEPGGSVEVTVSGGRPPYKWTLLQGQGLWFDDDHTMLTVFTTVPSVIVVAEDGLCSDMVGISIRDGCYQLATGYINITGITWDGDVDIDAGGSGIISYSDGIAPFTLEINGTGLFFDEEHTLTTLETSEREVTVYSDCSNCDGSSNTISITDSCGEYGEEIEGTVNTLALADPLTFDDASTPDTIVKNSNIKVYVLDGCGPFTYVVSGTGYRWNSNGLQTFISNNRNEQLDCANGTCGTDFAVYCDLTVTDKCGTVVSATIRNTAGKWGLYQTICGGPDSNDVEITGDIVGSKQYNFRAPLTCSGIAIPCTNACVAQMLAGIVAGTNGFPNADGLTVFCVSDSSQPSGCAVQYRGENGKAAMKYGGLVPSTKYLVANGWYRYRQWSCP